jgi:hypothetical protein
MYADKLQQFENVENLAGKAWEHATAIDLISNSKITNCSIHCFHYQQMFELLMKHLLETKTKSGAFPRSHKLNHLFVLVIEGLELDLDKDKYFDALGTITTCAEAYRYDFSLDCETYKHAVSSLDVLLDELIKLT